MPISANCSIAHAGLRICPQLRVQSSTEHAGHPELAANKGFRKYTHSFTLNLAGDIKGAMWKNWPPVKSKTNRRQHMTSITANCR